MPDEIKPTPQGENQGPKSERVVEVGKWFKPFTGYYDVPHDRLTENYSSKNFSFMVNGIGTVLDISTTWDPNIFQRMKNQRFLDPTSISRATVILPSENKDILPGEINNYQKIFETKIMNVGGAFKNWRKETWPILELRTPAGEIFYSSAIITPNRSPFGFFFSPIEQVGQIGGTGIVVLFVPEAENILDEIEMRVTTKGVRN